MAHIQTVTGPISPESLGFCHCHEHLMLAKGASFLVNKALCIDSPEKSLEEVKSFALAGGRSIVDAQPVGCGRDAESLHRISRESHVNIIASTGFHKMLFYPEDHWIYRYRPSQLSELFTQELVEGMYTQCDSSVPERTVPVKAGIIKCALDTCGLNQQYIKLFDAAVRAHRNTGAPLMVHIESGSDPLALCRYFLNHGVNPERIIFCHLDRTCPDLRVHKELCLQGIFLEYDTIGRFKYHDDNIEAGIFCEMTDSGYEDQLLFSLDTTRERMKSYAPDAVGLTYILQDFIPTLKHHGITDTQIRKFSTLNSQRILSIPH